MPNNQLHKAHAGKQLIGGRLDSSDDRNRVAQSLGLAPGDLLRAISPLIAIGMTDEFTHDPKNALVRVAELAKLNERERSRLMQLGKTARDLTPAFRERLESNEARKQLIVEHAPTWTEIASRVFYVVDHRGFATGKVRVLPMLSLRFKLTGLEGDRNVFFQVDQYDLDRLISAFQELQATLAEAAESIKGGDSLSLVTGPRYQGSQSGRRKKSGK